MTQGADDEIREWVYRRSKSRSASPKDSETRDWSSPAAWSAVEQALREFHATTEHDEEAPGQQLRFAVCLHFLLEHCRERAAPTPRAVFERCPLERARDCLQERFNESISLGELSAVAGLSRSHLVRTFKERFGVPPHAFQIHTRIARACVLLQHGVSPTDAASSVGFADQSHFTRHFKRILGVTPGQYARAAR